MRRKNPISHSYTIIALIAVILVAGSFMAYSLFGLGSNKESSYIDKVKQSSSNDTATDTVSTDTAQQPITLHGSSVDIQPAIDPNKIAN